MEEDHFTKTQQRELRKQEKEERMESMGRSRRFQQWKVGGIVMLIVAAFVGLVVWQNNQPAPTASDTFSDPFKGNADAKVVLREFSDLQCPACRAAAPMVRQLVEEFKDQMKFVYEDFPLPSHKNGYSGAEAGQCAYEEGKFFEFHDKLFDEQNTWGKAGNPTNFFLEYAEGIGLDRAEFEECLKSDRNKASIEEDLQQGRALKVAATPSFFVNDKLVSWQGIEDLQEAIQKAIDQN